MHLSELSSGTFVWITKKKKKTFLKLSRLCWERQLNFEIISLQTRRQEQRGLVPSQDGCLSFSHLPRPAVGPTQFPVQWLLLSTHSVLNAEKGWSHNSIPQTKFLYLEIFTFTVILYCLLFIAYILINMCTGLISKSGTWWSSLHCVPEIIKQQTITQYNCILSELISSAGRRMQHSWHYKYGLYMLS